jgi:hypothetical protein
MTLGVSPSPGAAPAADDYGWEWMIITERLLC